MFVFLSPEWIAAMREIRDEFAGRVDPPTLDLAANVTITDAPFDDPTVRGHVDTTGEAVAVDEGHIDHAHFGVELTYEIAEQIFVDRDPATVLQIVLSGRVKLTGDSARVLQLAGTMTPPDPDAEPDEASAGLAREILARVDAITHRDD